MQSSHNQAPSQQAYIDKYNSGGPLNWEIGRAQPAVAHLVQNSFFSGRVLDVGCGLGDNARCIAQQQHSKSPVEVLAIDLVK
jgi:2-polyprenyl-3-methyl-5-hydroxy-6-metoxy-1,4-benzoquinol methylase